MMSTIPVIDINTAINQQWDCIIIGSGMGGCSAAYKLAQHGKKILILDKGLANFSQTAGVEAAQKDPEERLQSAKWPQQLSATVDKRYSKIWAPLGCGAGGSTSLYAAALQRLEAIDFEQKTLPSGETISWPYSYKQLEPYYIQAEKLFSVCGSHNPLSKTCHAELLPPPAMCEADRHFFRLFQEQGLNPYRLHVGVKYQDHCTECGGHICAKSCKQDANNACLQPAIKTGNVFFLERAEVIRLNANTTQVDTVELHTEGKQVQIKAKTFILAAGAYFSPIILQNSHNDYWPQGLANRSGMVGKNLMFHTGHQIAFWPKGKFSRQGPKKTIALRDFYCVNGKKYGELQSTGLTANYGIVVYGLNMLFDQSPFRRFSILKQFLRIPAFIATRIYGNATIFATIVEDHPYHENRVIADPTAASGMRFEYYRHPELIERTVQLKKLVYKKLRKLKKMTIGGMNLNYGHPCGTCRAGNNPKTSVVDANGKAHDLKNLFIADGSFMPTSGGTNPSLTIAAHALKVADKVAEQLSDN